MFFYNKLSYGNIGVTMRNVSKSMIKKYELRQLGHDFMGYEFEDVHQLSFHHLLIPRRICKVEGVSHSGFLEWNGAILRQDTAHDYLHVVERFDIEMFSDITSEMVDENIKGFLDAQNIRNIDDILNCFEREYSGRTTFRGNQIIKEEYTRRLVRKRY